MSKRFLVADCSLCGRRTGDDAATPICSRCQRDTDSGLAGRPKLKFVRDPIDLDSPMVWEKGKLPCHRCGRPVIVAKGMEQAAALGPVVVECERPCARILAAASMEIEAGDE